MQRRMLILLALGLATSTLAFAAPASASACPLEEDGRPPLIDPCRPEWRVTCFLYTAPVYWDTCLPSASVCADVDGVEVCVNVNNNN